MSLPPDDWPRSPSGRTPEWARVEALGRQAPDPRWRIQAEEWLEYERPPRRRRRRGGRMAAFLALLLAGGIWWSASDDPRADITAFGDPATYGALADRVEGLLGGTSGGASIVDGTGQGPVPITGSGASGERTTPPIGLEESRSRIAPAVTVDDPSSAYAFAALQDDGSTPVAWSPCRPVHYVVNTDNAPSGFEGRVDAAIAELSAVTGLAFVDDGTTREDPAPDRRAYLPERYGSRWAPVLIAVADDDEVRFLEGDTAGVAYTYRVRGISSGVWHLVSGSVYIDREAFDLDAGSRADPSWLAILRHELGHLAGLAHLDDASQLMNPVTSGLRTYQAGDLTGLAVLGKGRCAPDV